MGRYVALKGLHGELRDATDRVETLKKCEDSRKNKPEIRSPGKRSATTDQPTKGLHEEGTTDVGKSRRKGEKKPRRV